MTKCKNPILNTYSKKICVINKMYLEGNVVDVIKYLERLIESYKSEGYHSFTLESHRNNGSEDLWLYGSKGNGPNEIHDN